MSHPFISELKSRLQGPLPGDDAHAIMASSDRKRFKVRQEVKPTYRKAAVLLLLFTVRKHWHTVLMLRPTYKGVHSGQVSFPGGKAEENETLDQTALREANEEVGIIPNDVELLGTLSDLVIPPSGFVVTPHVGYMGAEPMIIPDEKEVERTYTLSLKHLLDDSNIREEIIRIGDSGFKLQAPVFGLDDGYIWGATAMILSEFKELTKDIL